MSIIPFFAIQAATVVGSPVAASVSVDAPTGPAERFDLGRVTTALPFGLVPECGTPAAGEIVICGGRRDRYRLPLPREEAVVETGRVAGEVSTPASTLVPPGRCGMFTGEHRCGKAEAAQYGYGGGRDPVTVLTRLGTRLIDSDAELEPSPRMP